jgi:hypothetical protein
LSTGTPIRNGRDRTPPGTIGVLNGLLIFNLAILLLAVATLAQVLPLRLYDGFLRGLHNTIGITTPTDRQLRWVLVVWLLSLAAIVDGMALLLQYV